MDRETKIINTPIDNHKVELKSWINAREKREISSIFLKNTKFSAKDKDFDVNGELLNKLQDTQIINVVVAVNDNNEKVLDACLNMKAEDFEFILDEIEKIVNPSDNKKK